MPRGIGGLQRSRSVTCGDHMDTLQARYTVGNVPTRGTSLHPCGAHGTVDDKLTAALLLTAMRES